MSLKKEVLLGLKWTSIATVCMAIVGILKISILTRFLDKSDFGLMALIMFVLGFMNLFSDMGLSTAILHKQNITKKVYASLYWLNILFCSFLYFLLWLITPFVSKLYDQPELNTLIPLVGFVIVFSALGTQFKTIEIKNLNFKYISLIDIIAGILSLVVAVFLAINDYGILSLIYSVLLQSFVSNLLYFLLGLKKYGLLFSLNLKDTIPYLKIGVYQVGGQIVNYFNRDLDILLIAKFFSTEILGGYSLAKQLVFRPAQLINPILVKVASPTLAMFQNNLELLSSRYLKLINIVASINLPIYGLIIIFAPFVIEIMYGPGFEDIVSLVRVLSLYMIFRAIGNPIGSLVVATGKTHLEFIWNVLNLLLIPLAVYIGAQFDIIWVAISLLITSVLLFVPSWKLLVNKMTGASLLDYVLAIIKLDFNFKKLYHLKE
ncbi:MOP flippase family protein [Winogradskyella sp. UBA3174]|uniref:MOP flippase family protein n=1 Tax=Winogradskyella sp. UBA3174 TaxID=1947785 RepID=UPI0025F018E1|nr:MOP flippase family protein [Winogradskyella sp. UBA3174]|tara:strand:+ start:68725 stop:70023 length:1299 start_codon:yes stop_codon:yes gene_type:complete